jgi:hypothetical protein
LRFPLATHDHDLEQPADAAFYEIKDWGPFEDRKFQGENRLKQGEQVLKIADHQPWMKGTEAKWFIPLYGRPGDLRGYMLCHLVEEGSVSYWKIHKFYFHDLGDTSPGYLVRRALQAVHKAARYNFRCTTANRNDTRLYSQIEVFPKGWWKRVYGPGYREFNPNYSPATGQAGSSRGGAASP